MIELSHLLLVFLILLYTVISGIEGSLDAQFPNQVGTAPIKSLMRLHPFYWFVRFMTTERD